MAALCQTPHATPITRLPASSATSAGEARLFWSPCPSFPPKPSPQVNKAPVLVMAAQWKGPQDTCSARRVVAVVVVVVVVAVVAVQESAECCER
jgi:hypothetical protein